MVCPRCTRLASPGTCPCAPVPLTYLCLNAWKWIKNVLNWNKSLTKLTKNIWRWRWRSINDFDFLQVQRPIPNSNKLLINELSYSHMTSYFYTTTQSLSPRKKTVWKVLIDLLIFHNSYQYIPVTQYYLPIREPFPRMPGQLVRSLQAVHDTRSDARRRVRRQRYRGYQRWPSCCCLVNIIYIFKKAWI